MQSFSFGDIHGAPIDVSDAGDAVVVAGVPGKRIRVVNFLATGTNTVKIYSGPSATGTALTGPMDLPIGGTANQTSHFWTGYGEDLVLNLGLASQVGGYLTYVLRDE